MPSSQLDPFAPTGVQFRSVSLELIKVRLAAVAFFLLCSAAVVIILFFLLPQKWIGLLLIATVVAIALWLLWLIPRQVRAMGWAVTGTDLQIRKGIMFKSLTVVPLGRLQYVDVEEGPVARHFGIAQVKLHTASATTDAQLPGIPREQAAQLREQIADLAESNLEGI
ncbi:PH domain-containing protein [Varibaculum massiliense]|uniref:PH domain-containing protein n=1 Tax=Varibaculum massiliense TaxID=1852372 RepID=UPI00288B41DC|nr:PH domain-containing protein [Varibaculum massiliense]